MNGLAWYGPMSVPGIMGWTSEWEWTAKVPRVLVLSMSDMFWWPWCTGHVCRGHVWELVLCGSVCGL